MTKQPIPVWIRSAFNAFDEDGDGSLDIHELGPALQDCGFNISKKHLVPIIKMFDTVESDGRLDVGEFCALVVRLQNNPGALLDEATRAERRKPTDSAARARAAREQQGSAGVLVAAAGLNIRPENLKETDGRRVQVTNRAVDLQDIRTKLAKETALAHAKKEACTSSADRAKAALERLRSKNTPTALHPRQRMEYMTSRSGFEYGMELEQLMKSGASFEGGSPPYLSSRLRAASPSRAAGWLR